MPRQRQREGAARSSAERRASSVAVEYQVRVSGGECRGCIWIGRLLRWVSEGGCFLSGRR